jgi:outer membrane protein assembly factor BamD (BamD/ComL family)
MSLFDWIKRKFFFGKFTVSLLTAISLTSSYGAISESEKLGKEALSINQHDIAATRFQQALETPRLDKESLVRIHLLLIESLIRSNQADKAIILLNQPIVKDHPAAYFWKGQALTIIGKYQEAADILSLALTKTEVPYCIEALLTHARLLTAIGDKRGALAALNSVAEQKSPFAKQAKLDQIRLLLATNKIADARKNFILLKDLTTEQQLDAKLLNARILLAEKEYSKALDALFTILNEFEKTTQQLPESIHQAVIDQATAMINLDKKIDASTILLAFIQNHPDSPLLDSAFNLITTILPENLSSDDPITEKLIKFSVDSPNEKSSNNLNAQALYLRSKLLATSTKPEQQQERLDLLEKIHTTYPNHPLATKSLLDLAQIFLAQKSPEKSDLIFQLLLTRKNDLTSNLQTKILLANEAFKKKDFVQAAAYFTEAGESLTSSAKSASKLNAGISELLANNKEKFAAILTTATPKLKLNLELEQALYTASIEPTEAINQLDLFIVNHPEHPRLDEARICIASCAMNQSPPNLSLAKAQLDSIPENSPTLNAAIITRIKLNNIAKNYANSITLAQNHLKKFPDSPETPNITLQLGNSLYQNGDFADARITLQKLAISFPELSDPALLLAARAAAKMGTPQSLNESIKLFDQIITKKSSVSNFALLEKSQTLIDSKSTTNISIAVKDLDSLLKSLTSESPLFTPVGLLLSEALYALGGTNSENYSNTLLVLSKIQATPLLSDNTHYKIIYWRGRTLEELGKQQEAFEACYSAIELASKQQPTEWEFFDLCAFNALKIREKNLMWEATIDLAKKIATFKSPRSQEALDCSKRLTLKHMIWEN